MPKALVLTEYRRGTKTIVLERIEAKDEERDMFRLTVCRRFPSLRGAETAFLAEVPPARRDYFVEQIRKASKLRF